MSNISQEPVPRVLIIEDEPDLLDAMVSFLNLDGFSAYGAGSLREAEQWLHSHLHDVLVLDLGLPDGDGLHWLSMRSDIVHKGVIITTARGESPARVAGIRAGADAYLVKPVQLEELSGLIGNLMRRRMQSVAQRWQLCPTNWTLKSPLGLSMKLTNTELKVMKMVSPCPGQVVTRHALIVGLGHDPELYDPRRLEILVRRLRAKAEVCFGSRFPFDTAHGAGYSFTAAIDMI
jgi:two-component system OmpR family response regulator